MIKKKKSSKKVSEGSSKGSGKKVNFSGVQSGGRKKIPEGDYLFKVDKATWEESQAGNDMVVFESVVKTGPQAGWRGYIHCAVTPKALWKLRQMLEALGVPIVDGEMSINPKKYVGLEHGGSVETEEWEGKKRSKITDIFPVDQLGDEDEDSDEEESEEEGDEEEAEEEEAEDEDEDEEEDD